MIKSKVKIVALILAAGSGKRFSQNIPKQYASLFGKRILDYSIDIFNNHPLISHSLIVLSNKDELFFNNKYSGTNTAIGGDSRQVSVRNGLESLKKYNPDFILIHDSARPLVSKKLITNLCDEVIKSNAVIPALAVTDTVKRKIGKKLKTQERDNLYMVQTPQAFSFKLISHLHNKYKDKNFTDDSALCEEDNINVKLIAGEKNNIKITNPEDIIMAEYIITSRLNFESDDNAKKIKIKI